MRNRQQPRKSRREELHDRAMCLPSVYDLQVLVKLPRDSSTHIENLEKAYADARNIIVGFLDLNATTPTDAVIRAICKYRGMDAGDRGDQADARGLWNLIQEKANGK